MIDLNQVLEDVTAHLTDCLDSSTSANAGKLPGVKTVIQGDYPGVDSRNICVTVDWGGDSMKQAFGQSPLQVESQVVVRAYLSAIKNEDEAPRAARAIYSADQGETGLVASLRSFRGLGYMLCLTNGRYIRPDERPELRFTIGVEVVCLVKTFR